MSTAKLQRLELAKELFPDVMNGRKTDTLCWNNDGQLGLGFLEFYSTVDPALKAVVLVTGIQKGTITKFASRLRMNADQLLQSMKKHYPDITMDAQISLIEFMSPKETQALTDE